MNNDESIDKSIIYYKIQGGLGNPSKDASGITSKTIQLRDINGKLLAEYNRDSAWFIHAINNAKIKEGTRNKAKHTSKAWGIIAITTGVACIAMAAGCISQLMYYRTSNPRNWTASDILPAIQSTLGIKHQRRFIAIDGVVCNLEHVNRKIRQADSLFGFDFGGVFGYKTKCADDGYSDSRNGPFNMTEIAAIEMQCRYNNYGTPKWMIDALLGKGAKLVSSQPFSAGVSVFKTKAQSVSDVSSIMHSTLIKREEGISEEQPDNYCVGNEYVLEGSPLLLENIRSAE